MKYSWYWWSNSSGYSEIEIYFMRCESWSNENGE